MTRATDDSPRAAPFWRGVVAGTWLAFRRTAPWLLGAMLIRAVVLYDGQPSSVVAVFVAILALVLGCFVFALVTTSSSSGFWNLAAWVLGTAVAIDSVLLLLAVAVPMDAGDQLLFSSVYFWGFWTLVGAIAGFAYRMVSRGL